MQNGAPVGIGADVLEVVLEALEIVVEEVVVVLTTVVDYTSHS